MEVQHYFLIINGCLAVQVEGDQAYLVLNYPKGILKYAMKGNARYCINLSKTIFQCNAGRLKHQFYQESKTFTNFATWPREIKNLFNTIT